MKRVLLFALLICGVFQTVAGETWTDDKTMITWSYDVCKNGNKWVARNLKPAPQSNLYNYNVTIPSKVIRWRDWSEYDNTFPVFTIPYEDKIEWISVESIAKEAFSGRPLKTVVINTDVTDIGEGAFAGCKVLTDAKVGSAYISEEMFVGCTALRNLTISEGVESIGANALRGCTALESVTIPSSVTSVGCDPFAYCDNLASVTCLAAAPPSGEAVSPNVFITDVMLIGADSGIGSLKDKYKAEGWTVVEYNLNKGCGSDTGDIYLLYKTGTNPADAITDFYTTVSDSGSHPATMAHGGRTYSAVECGGSADFIKCGGDLNWHAHGKYVYLYYTKETSGLVDYINDISIDNSSRYAVTANGGSIAADLNVGAHGEYIYMHTYTSSPKSDVTLYVPRGSKAAYAKAPYWKEFGKIVEIGSIEDVRASKNVSGWLFDVSGFDAINVRPSEELKAKINGAIKIPASFSFDGVKLTVKGIAENSFEGCTGLTSVTIPESVTKIGNGAFYNCTGLSSVTLPASVTKIGNGAFCHCSSLKSIAIPEGVTSIGESAFCNCSSLTSIAIPEGVTSIADWAFSGCTGLTSVAFASTITSIGQFAFNSCSGLTDVAIPSTVTSISKYAFKGCTGLTDVTIPEGVTNIDRCAFIGCTGLSSVTLPSSVITIDLAAFVLCSSLTSVYSYMETPPSIDPDVFTNRANAVLYVPRGSKAAYEAAEGWKEFKEIVEIDTNGEIASQAAAFGMDIDGQTTGIGAIDTDDATTQQGAWFTLDGRKVAGRPTQKGVYIRGGKKVMVK